MTRSEANSHACPGCGHKIPVAEGAFVDHFVSRDGTRWMSDDTQPHISSHACPGGNRPVRQSSLPVCAECGTRANYRHKDGKWWCDTCGPELSEPYREQQLPVITQHEGGMTNDPVEAFGEHAINRDKTEKSVSRHCIECERLAAEVERMRQVIGAVSVAAFDHECGLEGYEDGCPECRAVKALHAYEETQR